MLVLMFTVLNRVLMVITLGVGAMLVSMGMLALMFVSLSRSHLSHVRTWHELTRELLVCRLCHGR